MSNRNLRVRGRRDWLAIGALFAVMNGCAGDGCGCSLEELPGGKLPADQTIEGGAQMRVTATGLGKIEQLVDDVVNDALGEGMCLNEGDQGIVVGDIEWCMNNDGSCTTACEVNFHVD